MTGKTVSHYRILEKLCGGGMGVVYEAEQIPRLQKAKTAPGQPARGFCPKNALPLPNPLGMLAVRSHD